ncbi:hypothetical protein MP638_004694 [Amoeboaphelidium occidentale]|nr:hypothetical protein MP638_004694 [Amoeboaphelidium occidentale]
MKQLKQTKLAQKGGQLTFGEYHLLQTLGEGEFGKVKLAINQKGRKFAIKFVKKSILTSDNRKEKLWREISIMQELNYRHIVRLYEVLESEKYVGMVLEYCSGGELFDHILAKTYLKNDEAKRYFAQLISGVAYLHAHDVVHRDLKLENLLLDEHKNIKISDFGFVNFTSNADLMSTSCGSPCYAAPELVLSDSYKGTCADIWSCGVILFSMLCGYLPYDDDPDNPNSSNVNLLYRYILNTELKFPAHVHPDAKHLVLRMLENDPEKRCSMDEIVTHPWLAPAIRELHTSFEDVADETDELKSSRDRSNSVPASAAHILNQSRKEETKFTLEHQENRQPLKINTFANVSMGSKSASPRVLEKENFPDHGFRSRLLSAPLSARVPSSRLKNFSFVNSTSADSPSSASDMGMTPPLTSTSSGDSPSAQYPEFSSLGKENFAVKKELLVFLDKIPLISSYSSKEHCGILDSKTVSSRNPAELIKIGLDCLLDHVEFSDDHTLIGTFADGDIIVTHDEKDNSYYFRWSNSSKGKIGKRRLSMKSITEQLNGLFGKKSRDISFTLEVLSVAHLPNVYCLQMKREKGDKWVFKNLYKTFTDRLYPRIK